MFPYLNEIQTSRDVIDMFYGYNANDRIRENEFADMKNMSSDKYPMMSPRKPRGEYRGGLGSPTGMIVKDNIFCYVDNSQFIIRYPDDWDGKNTKIIEDFVNQEPKQLVSMGAYVIILPDKKYVNITKPDDRGSIENIKTISSDIRIILCREDGTEYSNENYYGGEGNVTDVNNIPVGIKAPEEPEDGLYWMDATVEDSPMCKRWSSSADAWVPITSTYIKIKSNGIADGFFDGDGVEISGFNISDVDGIRTLIKAYRDTENNGEGDYIIVEGIVAYTSVMSNVKVTISRTMPDIDFVCESGNRLWGCKYGSVGGKFLNEIYASKLGDFRNWNCFEGLSTDSYAVSCGTDGPFTAAVSYGGRPTFFKENCMHMIYGSYPAEYQTVNTVCRGVQQGCEGSLAVVNEVLFYKSRAGIMTYDGSLPSALANVFGNTNYDSAIACGYKNKYYISMRNCDIAEYEFFVYDITRGLWHKEDNLHPDWICALRDNVFYVDSKDLSKIYTLFGDTNSEVEWYAITGPLGLSYIDAKYISRIDIRASMEQDSSLCVSINYDNEDLWKVIFHKDGLKHNETRRCGTVSIPIRTRRCDHFRLKFEGKGNVNIISISKIIEQGSDLRGGLMK